MLPIYASGDFVCTWNTISLSTGWGDDQFLTATPNGPITEVSMGADGSMGVSKLADQGGVITMTFKQTAQALIDISEVAAAQMLVGELAETPFSGYFSFEDPTGNCSNFVAYNTVLVDKGVHEHQKVMGERTITWACEKLIFGEPDDIMANMASFIKT